MMTALNKIIFVLIVFCSHNLFSFFNAMMLKNNFYTIDPHWNNVSTLIRCENNQLVDVKNKSFTNVGSVVSSVLQSKFGLEACYFSGSQYLDFSANLDFQMNTGNFTAEAWVYPASTNLTSIFGSAGRQAGNLDGFGLMLGSGGYGLMGNYQSALLGYPIPSSFPAANTWSHIALVRTPTLLKIYLNGIEVGTDTISATNYLNSDRFVVGTLSYAQLNYYYVGYLEELRITKGIARYTANFVPPVQQFPTR